MNKFKKFVNKRDFLESLTEKDCIFGLFRIHIFDSEKFPEKCYYNESIWAYFTKEEKEKIVNGAYFGEIKCILCNKPFNFSVVLDFGTEVFVKKDIDGCLRLSEKWMKEMLE